MTFGNRFPNVITEGLEVTVREREDRVYVLNSVEFLEALLEGAFGLGYIPIRYDDRNLPAIRYVANGIIIEYMPPEEPEKEDPPPVRTETPRPVVEFKSEIAVLVPPNLTPERVQEVLREILPRAPRVNTIRNWTVEQRREALDWATTVQKKVDGKSDDPIPPKPEFIVEPAARKRRSVDEAPLPDPRQTTIDDQVKHRRGRQPVMEVISETYDPDKPKTVEEDLFPESKASDFFNQDLDEVAEDPSL